MAMETSIWHKIHEDAEKWIREAGALLKKAIAGPLDVQTKASPDDLVTNMDKEIERFFIERIRATYPGHRIVSEEGYGDEVNADEGVIWLLDPIDGTMNFVHQKRHFAVSVGVYENGVGRVGLIYDVMADDLYHVVRGDGAYYNETRLEPLDEGRLDTAVLSINGTWLNRNRRIDPEIVRTIARRARGTRSYGSAAIELAYVAAGRLDAYLTMRLAPWDYGAGLILIEEVGGVISHVDGRPLNLLKGGSLLVGKKGVHREISQVIRQAIADGLYVEGQ
jgi:myo-inositol-1(or 4)-monophosphatase